MTNDIIWAKSAAVGWSEFERAMRAMRLDMEIRQVTYTSPEAGPDDLVVTVRLVGRKR